MVSFFGLRFGADKKKQQQKQADRKSTIQPEQQQQQQQDSRTPSVEEQLADHDFCQPPPRRFSRPGTSNSAAAGRSTNWPKPFPDVPAACSMIDLPTSSRRQPSIGSVSQLPGGEDLAAAVAASKPISSPASLALPSPYGNSVSLPGTPNKPQSARTKKWVDPLDMSISRSLSADDAGTTDMSVKSPLDKIRFDVQELGERGGMKIEQDRDMLDHDDGCPSPPHSVVDGGNELRPTISVTSIGNRVPAPLPSPAPSAPVSGEDKWEIPRIRNVKAKRDTMTFQSPRRRSFTMAIEEGKEDKQKMQQRRVEHTTQVVEISSHCMSAEEMRASVCMDMMESPTEMAQPHPFKEEQAGQESSEPQQKPQEPSSQSTSTSPAADARLEQPDPDAKLFEREAPKGFNSRARADSHARSPRPSLNPLKISTNVQSAVQPSVKPPLSPLASKTPMEGYFPVSNGLPRGRLPTRPSISVETSDKDHDDGASVYSAAAKDEVDIFEPCKSAIPAPLFLSGMQQDLSPGATMAPLPSPTFSNVDRVLSKDTIELAKTFEISLDLPSTSPIQCDFGDFGDFMSKD